MLTGIEINPDRPDLHHIQVFRSLVQDVAHQQQYGQSVPFNLAIMYKPTTTTTHTHTHTKKKTNSAIESQHACYRGEMSKRRSGHILKILSTQVPSTDTDTGLSKLFSSLFYVIIEP